MKFEEKSKKTVNLVEAVGENFASHSMEIDVYDFSLSQIKSELKRREFSVKGKKAALIHRLINF